ncbi:hypothetical protein VOLCADRAFT_116516 [Volvox carteri f. nagariensis]|uniref:Citrate transporter-like domain-containing protein n=1 Tax=Volvox carteri f. nagariensis TaxID=3068 RepID=D8TMP7_VOLCA|nr:uncharacterized protein VOLCADRAFT_116516 [Volvox carteri f. nagariensis]EFJ51291.1 hypothetical protein VOLCADRAFT_116516 [Volvox carteri f. nagariensis]|eukprot:XP_002947758.1 hypothetical protein VOLCADRAFT_116516 [Volvox carteri f. nagariensis]
MASSVSNQDVGSFRAIAALVIFCLAIVLTIFLVFKAVVWRIPVPGRQPFMISVKYYVAPVAAVLAMLACTSMSIADVGRGLLGNSQIQPYGILILFMSMAYIAGSLDATGVFAWLALKFTTMSGGRGRVLFLFYFLLSSFITTFTSNDVCILTLTPIVCYFAKATGVDPMPFLFAEYAAANTFGALLYTGNPTNIIVADAYNMTFLGYSKYMSLPTFAAGLACFAMLLLEFHRNIPASIPLPTVDASHMLRDKLGAVLGSVNMLTCLGLLAAAPSLGWAMWAITLVCAGVHCVYNIWAFRTSLLHVPIGECWTCGCAKPDHEASATRDGSGGSDAAVAAASGLAASCKMDQSTSSGSGDGAFAVGSGVVAEKAGMETGVRQAAGLLANGRGDRDTAFMVEEANEARDSGINASPMSPSELACGRNGTGSNAGGKVDSVDRNVAARGPGCCADAAAPAAENSRDQQGDIRRCLRSAAAGHTPACLRVSSGSEAEAAQRGPAELPPVTSVVLAEENGERAAGGARIGAPQQQSEQPLPPVMTVDSLRGKAPTFWALFFDLPWEVVPFALGMFVLVEGLYVQGWLNVFGNGLGRRSTELPAAIFIMGFLSVILANTINNQPMTILLTRVALDARYTANVGHGNTHKAALFALVLGSNIGAVFTLIGALAGILWSNIIGIHGLKISYAHFFTVCSPVGFMTLVASLLTLWFEFAVFPHSD